MKKIGIFIFALLLVSCNDDGEGPKKGGNGNHRKPGVLAFRKISTTGGAYTFSDFDNALGEDSPSEQTITIPGGTFFEGTLTAYDGAKVSVYAVLVPNALIDRVLIQINGGTGTDPRHFLQNYNHRAVIAVSMRGLHPDDIRTGECELGSGLVNCLKGVSWLKQVNPKDNGKDVVDIMNIILGNGGKMTVDGEKEDHSFFGVGEKPFNIETGSYGATILGYALADSALPPVGRVFIDGPSSPGEYVISDGFRNAKVAVNNALDAIGMSSSEKDSFLNVMKARHSSFNTNCDPTLATSPTSDCLSSAMLFYYLTNSYNSIVTSSSDVNGDLSSLESRLLAVPAVEATSGDGNLSSVTTIYANSNGDILSARERNYTTWESAQFDFISSSFFSGFKSAGFVSRVGQICSAYINRRNGDSQTRFNGEKAKSSNDPYWYGFLIGYRSFLKICPQIASNLTTGIAIPDGNSLDVRVEAFVQYGAGIDEKHHEVDIEEMASYIHSSSVIKSVYMVDHVQGGSGKSNASCLEELKTATFETPSGTLSTGLDSTLNTHCGVTP